jgi:hypothetical protein
MHETDFFKLCTVAVIVEQSVRVADHFIFIAQACAQDGIKNIIV